MMSQKLLLTTRGAGEKPTGGIHHLWNRRGTRQRWRTRICGNGNPGVPEIMGCPTPPIISGVPAFQLQGVKSCKRLLMHNTGPNGELDTPSFQRAMLQYRNTPDQETKMSPAMIVFGRSIRDFIPVLPARYTPHKVWVENSGLRESALR